MEEAIIFSYQLKFNSLGQIVLEHRMLPLEELDNPDLQDLPIPQLKELLPMLHSAFVKLSEEANRILKP